VQIKLKDPLFVPAFRHREGVGKGQSVFLLTFVSFWGDLDEPTTYEVYIARLGSRC